MKKLIKSILVTMILLLSIQPVFAEESVPSSWAKEYVEESISAGYIPVHLQSNYQDPITREEFTELVVTTIFAQVNERNSRKEDYITLKWKFKELTLDNYFENVSTDIKFSDTDSKYVKVANTLGIVNGVGNNNFAPNDLITREQACVMFMNYAQTQILSSRDRAHEELEDLNEVSSWAQLALELSYDAGLLLGTKAPILDSDYNILEKGYINPKGNLTREQAIIVVKRMADKDLFNNIVIKGYLKITMDQLMHGIKIKGNTISLLKTGYDNDYSEGMMTVRTYSKLREFIGQYDSIMFEGILCRPFGLPSPATDPEYYIKLLKGAKETFDFDVITVKHNNDKDSVVTVIRNDHSGYFKRYGSNLGYETIDNFKQLVLEN